MSPEPPTSPNVEAGLSRAMLAHQLRLLLASAGADGFGCIIDVGAHRGESALKLRDLGHRGRLVSFEPHPASFAELERSSAADPDWQVHRLALGDRSGEAELIGRASADLSSLLPNSDYGAGFEAMRPDPEPAVVELARLDDVFGGLLEGLGDPRVMLKIDVQGAELAVLEGAAGSLARIAAIQVELTVRSLYEGAPSWRAPIELLEAAGFELSGLVPVGRDPLNRLIDVDCLMIRPHVLDR